ncbi:MAG: SCP2 sterol-binding domain-containing protein [Pirellulales bacterium]|nr:SCP2 sterol-binding domain-containing protein [Planctomycetales bacterium]
MPLEHCKQVFDAMPSRFKPEGAGNWNATIQFLISGDKGGDYVVKIEDGTCTTSEGVTEAPSATLTTDADTWLGIINGTTNPMMAFTLGKIKISGSMGDVMKLQNPAVFGKA